VLAYREQVAWLFPVDPPHQKLLLNRVALHPEGQLRPHCVKDDPAFSSHLDWLFPVDPPHQKLLSYLVG